MRREHGACGSGEIVTGIVTHVDCNTARTPTVTLQSEHGDFSGGWAGCIPIVGETVHVELDLTILSIETRPTGNTFSISSVADGNEVLLVGRLHELCEDHGFLKIGTSLIQLEGNFTPFRLNDWLAVHGTGLRLFSMNL